MILKLNKLQIYWDVPSQGIYDKKEMLCLKAADVLVMPSKTETCGLVQMKAMSFGTLVIGTPVGAIEECITDRDNKYPVSDPLWDLAKDFTYYRKFGYLIEPLSADVLASRILLAYENWSKTPQIWAERAYKAWRKKDEFSWLSRARYYLKLLRTFRNLSYDPLPTNCRNL